MDTTIINCDCLCHSLHVRHDKEHKSVNIALWNYGLNNGKLNWKYRLKILMDGYADSDLVVLNEEELDKLIEALQEAKKNM